MKIKTILKFNIPILFFILFCFSSCAKTDSVVSAGSSAATQGEDLTLRKDSSEIAPVVDKDDTSPQSAARIIQSETSTSSLTSTSTHKALVHGDTDPKEPPIPVPPPPPNPTPKLPGGFAISNVSRGASNVVTISWEASENANSYSILRGPNATTLSQIMSNVTALSFVDTGLVNGTTYYYSVTAHNDDGSTPANAPLSVSIPSTGSTSLPGNFSIISLVPVIGSVTLNWIGTSNVDSYSISRGSSAGALTTIASNHTGSSYVDSSVSNGTTYFYNVTAHNTNGSTPSNTMSVTTPTPGLTTPPGNFSLSSLNSASGGVTVSWGASVNATNYSVLRGTSANNLAPIITNLSSLSYTDATAGSNTTYYYSVTAYNANGNTPASAPMSVTIPSSSAPGPFAITSVVQGTKKVILTWGASVSAVNFTVKRGTSIGSYGSTLTTTTLNTYTDTSCSVGTTYYYMVTATNATNATTNATAGVTASPQWGTQQLDGGANDRRGSAIAIDRTNSYIYVASRNGDVNKYDRYATNSWNVTLGAPRIGALSVDSYASIFASGTTTTPIGDGVTTRIGTSDIFVSKLDASGTKLWTVEAGIAAQSMGVYGMTNDNTGNIYIAASVGDGGLIYDNDDMAITKLNNMTYVDYAWIKFDKAVSGAYTKTASTQQGTMPRTTGFFTYANGIASDNSGNTYITGWTNRTTLNSTLAPVALAGGRKDVFIVKYNNLGTLLWTRQYGVSGFETKGTAITLDTTNYFVYITGTTTGGLDGNTPTGATDSFLIKLDTSGTKQWTQQFGVSGSSTKATGITLDSAYKVYISGYTTGALPTNTLRGATDFFVAKYDPSPTTAGVIQPTWTKQFGVSNTSMKAIAVSSVLTSGVDNIYVTGETGGGMDDNPLLNKIGLFLIKLDASGNKK